MRYMYTCLCTSHCITFCIKQNRSLCDEVEQLQIRNHRLEGERENLMGIIGELQSTLEGQDRDIQEMTGDLKKQVVHLQQEKKAVMERPQEEVELQDKLQRQQHRVHVH